VFAAGVACGPGAGNMPPYTSAQNQPSRDADVRRTMSVQSVGFVFPSHATAGNAPYCSLMMTAPSAGAPWRPVRSHVITSGE